MEKRMVNAVMATIGILCVVLGAIIFFVKLYMGTIEHSGIAFLLAWVCLITLMFGKENETNPRP